MLRQPPSVASLERKVLLRAKVPHLASDLSHLVLLDHPGGLLLQLYFCSQMTGPSEQGNMGTPVLWVGRDQAYVIER